ncbi:BTAD domain-containing putative transcriptional regulator [Planomonospora corallina]|uniref:BTAD domain-containing putative transcriptional regulator n=1 Tax=Planomonospora corallina TaxID=1806052 RepID=A0ABV8IDQ4_9ACTN
MGAARGAGTGNLVDFRMLGPLEIYGNGQPVRITAPKQRALLALLLLDANQLVAEERLIDDLWNGCPPSAARESLQSYVYRLRKALSDIAGVALRRDGDSYRLTVEPGSRDVDRFDQGVAAASATRDAHRSVSYLQAALNEWRGPLLADIDVQRVIDERTRYESMRLTALERYVRGELELGCGGELVPELERLVCEYPLSESLWCSLMTVLWRAGRRGEAVAAYARARRCLVEELGIEPGTELQRLHHEILEGSVARPTASPTGDGEDALKPAQLPADVADFTGRGDAVAELVEAASAESAVLLIVGPAGVGKTVLAVHVAHRLRERYPDGQLYVDLGGAQRTPERPADVLASFLHALGHTRPMPASEAERAALYRSVLARRRVLVVLDNAVDILQVKPLLAAGPSCATVITGRNSLATLPVTRRLRLGPFTEDEAVEFLGGMVNGRGGGKDAEIAAAEVARLCDRLPLALRIAGARAESLMGSSLSVLAERLADHRRRLAELELDDLSVSSSFELSYDLLGNRPEAARAFRLLGLLDGPDITVASAAALLGTTPAAAETALLHLVRTQLLEPYQPGRYRMHDLVRLYAAHRAEAEAPREFVPAVSRLLGEYRFLAEQAVRVLTEEHSAAASSPRPFAGAEDALGWFDTERANLLAAIRAGLRWPECEESAAETTRALTWLFRFRGSTDEWARVNDAVLPVGRRRGNTALVADTLDELGKLRRERGDLAAALAYARECLGVRQEIGEPKGEVRGRINLGVAHHLSGSVDEAVHQYEAALAMAERIGDRLAQGYALSNLAAAHREAGRYDRAGACNAAAVEICRELGDNPGRIDALDDLATTHRAACRFGESLAALEEAIEIANRVGYVTRAANLLREIGETHLAAGDVPNAIAALTKALDIFNDTSDHYGRGRALRLLGEIYRSAGDAGSARRCWNEALAVLADLGSPEAEEVRALAAG